MASLLSTPFMDVGSGIVPSDGALLNFYVVGSGTRKDSYTTAAATTAHANPVVADALGVFPAIYISGSYDWVLTDKNAVQKNTGSVDEFAIASGIDPDYVKPLASVAAIQAATLTGINSVQTLGYTSAGDGGAALYRADLTDTTSADDGFLVILSNDSIRFKLVYEDVLNVKWAGAVGDSTTDDLAEVQKVIDQAKALALSYQQSSESRATIPAVTVFFPPADGYRVSASMTCDDPISMKFDGGGRTLIRPDDFNDYPLKLSGEIYSMEIRGFTWESTQAGCINVEGDNVSASRVLVDDCRFMADNYLHNTGIGIRYRMRSSQLLIKRTYFNRIAHPVHNRECDFVTFNDNCWFGFAFEAVYADRDGYIRNDSGFMRMDNCLFAGGPADNPVGVGGYEPAGRANGTEIAYFNIGEETPSGDVTETRSRLSIRNTRIGFEQGAGALVNYFTPYVSGGTDYRSGIFIDNIISQPREEKEFSVDGTEIAYLIRLFTMPNYININGMHGSAGNIGVLCAGSTTTLKALRESIGAPVDYNSNLADLDNQTASNQYYVNGIAAVNAYMIVSKPNATINFGAGYATGAGITMVVDALPKAIASGEVITFTGGGVFTLTADAAKGAVGITGDLVTAAVADNEVGTGQPTVAENQKWLELFNKFNYFFVSDFPLPTSSGDATEINIDTFFTGFDTCESSVFKVRGGVHPSVAGTTLATAVVSGTISLTNENNSSQDRISVYYDSDIDYTAQILGIEITPFFMVAGSPVATMTQAQAAAGATLRLRIRHAVSPGSVNVRCRGLMIKPIQDEFKSLQIGGFVQS